MPSRCRATGSGGCRNAFRFYPRTLARQLRHERAREACGEDYLERVFYSLEYLLPDDAAAQARPGDIFDALEDQQERVRNSPALVALRAEYVRRRSNIEAKGHRRRGGRVPGSRNSATERKLAAIRALLDDLPPGELRLVVEARDRGRFRAHVEAEIGLPRSTAARLVREALARVK